MTPPDPFKLLVQLLEEASLSGLPALRTEHYDGWLLCQSGGPNRRANSIWPLHESRRPISEKIEYCEASYARADLPCTFKMTVAAEPAGLDAALERRGYRREGETLVFTSDLDPDCSPVGPVTVDTELTDAWFDAWCSLTGATSDAAAIRRGLLAGVPTPSAFATVQRDGRIVGCGRAVISGNWVGLYDLYVHPDVRRTGVARDLMAARLEWAWENGASSAFLQVVAENDAARALQRSGDFTECYRYWYRVKKA
jgi:N-acetylglutamate synthase